MLRLWTFKQQEQKTEKTQRRRIMVRQSTADDFKKAAGMSIGLAVVMIVLGLLVVGVPLASGIGVSILMAWIIVLSGFTYLAYAFAARSAGAFIWRMLVGIVYIIGGGYLAFHPGLALTSFTLVLAVVLLFEGIMAIVVFFKFRSLQGSGWILFDGIVTLFLSYLIWRPWPLSSAWAIGTLLGINLMVSGITWLMLSAAARRALKAA
jgi:uncharacterized membrane protein HdeD (DUF308 family)